MAWVRTVNVDGTWRGRLTWPSRTGMGRRATSESLERDLRIGAVHDGRGHISPRFVLRGPRRYEPEAWEASVVVRFDAGQDMRRLASELGSHIPIPLIAAVRVRGGAALVLRNCCMMTVLENGSVRSVREWGHLPAATAGR
jgi:hypothetical protein